MEVRPTESEASSQTQLSQPQVCIVTLEIQVLKFAGRERARAQAASIYIRMYLENDMEAYHHLLWGQGWYVGSCEFGEEGEQVGLAARIGI